MKRLFLACSCLLLLGACSSEPGTDVGGGGAESDSGQVEPGGPCRGIYPSYWQDPNPKFAGMWEGQTISNVPPMDWDGPVFRLSDAFPTSAVDESADQPWRDSRFDALFDASSDLETRTQLALEYGWAVMRYIQEGNVENDFDVCENTVRAWYHMPFQTYEALTGRDFTHGLTREARVSYRLPDPDNQGSSTLQNSSMWAVAYFNPTAAYTLGQVWSAEGTAVVPATDVNFEEGAVVAKPLFNTSSPEQIPILANMPAWRASISDPSFCSCKPSDPNRNCTLAEKSEQCPRSLTEWGPVRLFQFDIAVKESRAPGTNWVYGTFVADGQRKASQENPWDRISLLGLIWGNETPPAGQPAYAYPSDPRQNGFAEGVIMWDTVDMLQTLASPDAKPWEAPGHLGCNSRLNGPADNANSSCLSCHMTASVPDQSSTAPPAIAQFNRQLTEECVRPDPSDPNKGTDATGNAAEVKDGVSFTAMDGLYFANNESGTPIEMVAQTASGPVNILGDHPDYADGRADWISLDFSLQLSISLMQWQMWQKHESMEAADRVHKSLLPIR